MRYSKVWLDRFEKFVVNLAQTMPAGCAVTVSYKVNGGTYVAWTGTEAVSDAIRNSVTADQRIDARDLQVKVSVTTSGNNSPILEDLVILLQ